MSLNNYHALLFHGGHGITPCTTSLHVLLKGTSSSMTDDSNDSCLDLTEAQFYGSS
jgi:hypothetical protein